MFLCSSCLYFLTLQYPIVDFQQKGSCPDSSAEQSAAVAVSVRGFQTKQVTAESLAAVQLRVLYRSRRSCNRCPWMFFQDEVSITGELERSTVTLFSIIV